MNNENSGLFLEGAPIGKLIRKFCIPTIISLLVATLYNIVDQIFIANADYLGSYGNAANSVVFPLTLVAMGLAMLLGDGGCTIASIALGAKENDRANKVVGCAVTTLIIAGIALMAVYLIFPDWIIRLFGGGVNERTFELSKEYFFWISLGIPFYMFGQAMNPIARADGSPRFAMIVTTIGAIINVVLDPIFIYGFRWGMFGAALATIIGQIIVAVIFAVYAFRMKTFKLSLSAMRPRWRLLKKILPQGAESMLVQFSIVLSMAIVFRCVEHFGASDPVFSQEQYAHVPTAVIGITMKFFQVAISVAIGLASGCFSIAGYNKGAHRPDRVRKLMNMMLTIQLIYGAVMSAVFLIFPLQFANIFGAEAEGAVYTEYAIKSIRIFLGTTIISCFNKGVCIYQQAIGNLKMGTFLSMLREVVFGAGLPYILCVMMGLDGILWFMPLSDVVAGIISLIVTIRTTKELKKKEIEFADDIKASKERCAAAGF
mgnify:CR=1 FL=1